MGNENTILAPDEAWVVHELRKIRGDGFGTITIKVHGGVAQDITIEQKRRRMNDVTHTILRET